MKNWKVSADHEAVLAAQYGAGGCSAVLEPPLQKMIKRQRVQGTDRGKRVLMMILLAGLVAKFFYSSEMASLAQMRPDVGMEWHEEDLTVPDYREYAASFEAVYPETEVLAGAEDCVQYEENGVAVEPVLYTNYAGMAGSSIYTAEDSCIQFAVTVKEEGFYDLALEYYPVEGEGGRIERSILVDGALPYRELERVSYDRVGVPAKMPVWTQSDSYDSTGASMPLSVYLTAGEHTLSFVAVEEPMVIHQVILKNEKAAQEYGEVKAFWDAVGIRAAGGQPVCIEAEHMTRASSQVLHAIQEQMPAAGEKELSGCAVSGESWDEAGQWAEWEFDVEEPGYYHISLYDRQNYVKHTGVYRKIMIDGEVPFAEMTGYHFSYGRNWREETLSDEEGTPYVFFLKQGHHTLRMETVLGDLETVMCDIHNSLRQLNAVCYQMDRAIAEAGDCGEQETLAGLREELAIVSGQLKETIGEMQELTGSRSGGVKVLTALKAQLDELITDTKDPAGSMKELWGSVRACRNWADGAVLQPLSIDRINIVSAMK